MVSDTPPMAATDTEWRAIADQLATALQQALLRNPNLPPAAWDQGQAALARHAEARESSSFSAIEILHGDENALSVLYHSHRIVAGCP